MKASDLFVVILKVIGIYLLKDLFLSAIDLVYTFLQLTNYSLSGMVFPVFVSLAVVGVYIAIIYILLFRTASLVRRLRLTQGLTDQPLMINLHRSSVYRIAIIVTGLVILVFAFPELVRNLYYWYQHVSSEKSLFLPEPFDYSFVLMSATKVIIGLLFLGNQQLIVNFVESRRRGKRNEQSGDVSQ